MKFKGYDWTELVNAVMEGKEEYETESTFIQRFKDFLIAYAIRGEDGDSVKKDIIKNCRVFLKALIKVDKTYRTPLFKGLLEIKDNNTFIKYFCLLLEELWT